MRQRNSFLRNSTILISALWLLNGCSESTPQAAAPQSAPEVGTYQITASNVAYTSELPGRTTDYRQAEIRPQVSGILLKRLFTEGQQVAAGDLLYQIDAAPYEAALATADANVAKAQVAVKNAKTRLARLQELVNTKVVSQQDVDDANAVLLQAEADLKAAIAQRQSARINLNYTAIKAPIAGQIGRSAVTEGALLTANQSQVLATIRQLDPIYVDLTQSASELLQLRRRFPHAQNEAIPVTLLLEDGSAYAQQGELQFSEASVDPSTGMVALRAVFPNTQGELLPGMFVRASLAQAQQSDALLVPQAAVTRTPRGGATVMVVKADSTVERREVKLGRTHEQFWVAESGLAAGEQVITAGLQKVQPGMQVKAVAAQE